MVEEHVCTAPTPAVHAEPRLQPGGPTPSSTEKTV